MILVGDDTGSVMSLKLSPNLRKMTAPKIADLDHKKENEKLDRLLLLGLDNGNGGINSGFAGALNATGSMNAASAVGKTSAVESKSS